MTTESVLLLVMANQEDVGVVNKRSACVEMTCQKGLTNWEIKKHETSTH